MVSWNVEKGVVVLRREGGMGFPYRRLQNPRVEVRDVQLGILVLQIGLQARRGCLRGRVARQAWDGGEMRASCGGIVRGQQTIEPAIQAPETHQH